MNRLTHAWAALSGRDLHSEGRKAGYAAALDAMNDGMLRWKEIRFRGRDYTEPLNQPQIVFVTEGGLGKLVGVGLHPAQGIIHEGRRDIER